MPETDRKSLTQLQPLTPRPAQKRQAQCLQFCKACQYLGVLINVSIIS